MRAWLRAGLRGPGEWGWIAPATGTDFAVDFCPAAGLADSRIVYFVVCLAG
jgi:hypothetical protein